MTSTRKPIHFDDFATHLSEVFEELKAGHRPVLVERDGEVYRIEQQKPDDIWANYDPQAVRRSLQAYAGTLTPEEAEELKTHVYRARDEGTRPSS